MDKSYIPEQIKDSFITDKSNEEENNIIEGHLQCSCLSTSFNIKMLGETKKPLFGNPFLQKVKTSHGEDIEIVAICSNCGKEIRLFNSYINGYDALVTSENNVKVQFESKLQPFTCFKCCKDIFNVHIKYEYPSIEDLEENEIDDFGNAFLWIWISLTCSSCSKKYPNFVDLETG